MEKELDSGFHFQCPEWRSSYLNIISDPLITAGQNPLPACLNAHMNPAYGIPPLNAYSELPHVKASQTKASTNWFNVFPRYGKAFASPVSSMSKNAFASEQTRYDSVNGSQKTGPFNGHKRFLVFDQSGDQTTLIYSSPVGAPMQYPTWNPEPPTSSRYTKDLVFKRDAKYQYSPLVNVDDIEDNPGDDDMDSEMHEDTEEINALLYSDDDEVDYSDNDEVTSTGHSPSTMTDHGIQQCPEEVACSASPFKRQKLGECNLIKISGEDSGMPPFDSSIIFEEDAESGCGNYENQVEGKCLSGKKRSRNEKVRETVSILRNIIPGVKGKDALVVIDEAIHYLKSLKVKVQSVGLEAL